MREKSWETQMSTQLESFVVNVTISKANSGNIGHFVAGVSDYDLCNFLFSVSNFLCMQTLYTAIIYHRTRNFGNINFFAIYWTHVTKIVFAK